MSDLEKLATDSSLIVTEDYHDMHWKQTQIHKRTPQYMHEEFELLLNQ